VTRSNRGAGDGARFTRREWLCWSAAGAAPLIQVGCACADQACAPRAPIGLPASGEWHNAPSTVNVKPALLGLPRNARELVDHVRAAAAAGKRIRMTGSGHSYSDAAVTDDHLLLPTGLTRVLDLDRRELRAEAQADHHLVRVQAGITLHELNCKLADQQLALENMGGYDAQTIAGVMMTATHGSGFAFGPIASQIVSLQMVVAGGELVQIEPAQGITDPSKFGRVLADADASGIPVRLIQGDEHFNAAVVSLGCIGIVYAVVVRTVDAFWIQERRSLQVWEELAKPDGYLERYLAHPRDPAYPDHVEISINPYPRPNAREHGHSTHSCLLTERHRFAKAPPATPSNQRRGVLGQGHLFADPSARQIAEDVLVDILDHADPAVLSDTLDVFMQFLVNPDYADKSFNVFNLGDINQFRVWGIELAFSIEQTAQAVQALFELAAEELAAGRHHSVPVTLRFVKASSALVAMQSGRDTTMMEIGMLVRARGSQDLLRNYERAMIERFSARPHWGLDLSILEGPTRVAELYPHWADWLGVRAELNPDGTFDGALSDRLGFSATPSHAGVQAVLRAAL
jgi:hypothetical protein